MVGIVSGNGLGLFNTSLDTLGFSGGQTGLGQAGGSAYVNLATGNLAVQFVDETMSGTGADLVALRTYNSTGTINDGDADGWRWSGEKRIELLSGTKGSSGSVRRTGGDGSQTTYTWNSSYGGYLSTDGSGAHDVIKWNSSTGEWEFRQNNSSETVEYYNGSSGWIKRLQDSSGNRIDYTFSGNKLTKIVDSISGQTIELVYGTSGNGNGKVVGINTRITATGTQIRQVNYSYDGYGRLYQVKTDLSENNSMADGKIYTTTYTYQNTSSRRIASISQSDGTSVNFTYDGSNRIRTVTDQTGVTTFTYSGSSTAIKNGENQTWTYTFDGSKRLTKVSSPSVNGVIQSTTYTYDSSGNVKTVADGKGKLITYTYDSKGNRTKEVDSLGNTVSRTFSSTNKVLTETRYSVASTSSPSGAETIRYVYDSSERLVFTVSAEGNVSELRYNARGLVERMYQHAGKIYSVSSLGTTTSISLSQMNSWKSGLTGTQKSQAQLTVLQYDGRGNLNKKTAYATVNTSGNGVLDNAATITEYVYSEHGQLLQTIAVRGSSRTAKTTLSSMVYDGMGRVTSSVSAGTTVTTSYSGVNITVSNSASGLTVVSTTDSRGRLSSVTKSGNGTNRVTKYVYDNAGRLRMTESASGARSFTFYDAAGRVDAVVDATGAAVAYTYDANGRVLTETAYVGTTSTSSWYSSSTNTVTKGPLLSDAIDIGMLSNPTYDRKTTYTYDDAGRLKTTAVTGGLSTVTNTYDGASRLTAATQSSRVTRFFYDKDGRQIGSLNAEKYLSENIYDNAGRLVEVRRYGTQVSSVSSFSTMRNAVDNDPKTWLSTFIYYDAQGRKVGSVNEQGFLSETVYDEVNNKRKDIQYMKSISVSASDTLASAKTKAGSDKRTTTTQFDGYGRISTVTQNDDTGNTAHRVISRNVYDSAGRLVRAITAEGTSDQRATRTQYNAFGEVTGVVSGVGEATLSSSASTSQISTAITNYGVTYQYDGAGRKITEIGAYESGKPRAKTFYFYNNAGQLTHVMNARGEVSKTTYNTFGQVSQVRIYGTRISSANLNTVSSGGHESAITGKVISNSSVDSIIKTDYNQLGLVSKITDAENFITTKSYDSYGQLQNLYEGVVANNTSNTIRSYFTYDLLGQVKERYGDYNGIRSQYSTRYDGFGRITQTIDANRKTTNFNYKDSNQINDGRVVTITDPVGNTRKTEVDAFGRTVKSYDGYGKLTQYVFDDANRSLKVINPDNTEIVTTKTRTGETLQVTDARNKTIKYTYTKDGQLDTVHDGKNVKILDNKYDRSGRLFESVDGNGVVTRYSYDAANRVILKQVDPDGGLDIRTEYEFDAQGRQFRVIEAPGAGEERETKYLYDRKGQVKQIIVDPNGLKLSTKFSYDGQGNTLTVERGTTTSPSQQKTTYTFDKLGRKTQEVVNGLNITTKFRYDKNGNLTRIIDPRNYSTWFIYDNAGQRTHSIDATGGVTLTSYDKNGRVHHVRQYANTMSVSGLGSLDSPTTAHITIPSTSGADRRSYNVYDEKTGRLVYSLQAKTSSTWVVSESRYDANGNVVKLIAYDKTLSDSSVASIASSGSLITPAEVASQLSALGYGTNSFGNARVTSYEYDANNRQTKTILAGWYDTTDDRVYNSKASQSDRFQRTIEVNYDNAGNAVSNKIKTGTGSGDYIYQYRVYDNAGRQIYDVDGLGNVTGKEYYDTGEVKNVSRYGSAVSVKTSGFWTKSTIEAQSAVPNGSKRTISFTYDKAGREKTVSQPTGGLKTNYYDAFGNLTRSTQKLNSSQNADTYYYYDAANRLVLTVDAEKYGTKNEYDAAGNTTKVTEYATRFSGTPSTSSQPTFSTSNKDRITQNTYDALGQVTKTYRALFDNTSSLRLVSEKIYNRLGEVTSSYDEKRNLTQMNYDRLGQVTKVTEPYRWVAGTGTDVFQNQKNARPITEITYNAFGESTKEVRRTTAGAGAQITIEHVFDAAGNEVETKDGNGNISKSYFDVSGKVIKQTVAISVTDAPSNIDYNHTIERRYEYDKAGRQIASVDIYDGKQTGQISTYNAYGDVTEERKIWGSASSSVASLKGNSANNALVASYVYHANGQLNYKRSQEGYVYFSYDYANRVTHIKQRESTTNTSTERVTQNIYDKLGRVIQRNLPKSNVTTAFGSTGNTLKTPIIYVGYDRWGNVTSESGDTVGVTKTYNQDNQVLTETKANVNRINLNSTFTSTKVTNKYNYDSLGRLTSQVQYAYNGSSTSSFNSRTVVTNSYNAAGQLTRTVDATNVDADYVYDIHGNKVGSRDAIGHVTKYTYDNNNQMTGKFLLRVGSSVAYKGPSSGTPTAIRMATYKYDQAGRKYAEGDALSIFEYYKHDARGNIVTQLSRSGGEKVFEFDELGHKTAEKQRVSSTYDADPSPYGVNMVTTYSNLAIHSWSYKNSAGTDFLDYQSDLLQKRQIANDSSQVYTYVYDNRGQLINEKRNGTTVVTYNYWQNGLQKSISESNTVNYTTTTNTSNFYYDVRGNKTVDYNKTTVSIASHTEVGYGGTTYTVPSSSSNTGNFYTYYAYDIQNRLTQVKSPVTTVKIGSVSKSTTDLKNLAYDYDEWGNRRRIKGQYNTTTRYEWFAYDAADRVLIESGSSNGSAITRGSGKEYEYDTAGRRAKEFMSFRTQEHRGGSYGSVLLGTSTTRTDRIYSYNDLGLVSQTRQSVVQSGYVNNSYTSNENTYTYDNRGFKTKEIQYKKNRTVDNTYNADGTLRTQWTKVRTNGRKESYLVNNYNNYGEISSYSYTAYNINTSSNSQQFYNTYSYSYTNTYAGRQVNSISVNSSQSGTATGTTYNSYDSRGRMTSARITESSGSTTGTTYRYFGYNANGQIIGRYEKKYGSSTYKVQNYYYAPNGGELANLGGLGYNISPLSPVASGGNTPGTYTVNAGDTLMGIATMLFGDAKLWYVIADANGLTMGPTDSFSAGDVGRNLRIPNSDKNISNTSNNWKPYNPTEIIGDLTPDPTILPPPKKKGCGLVAMIIMVVVAVVLTVVTAGAAAVAMAGAGSSLAAGGVWAAGTAALSGGLTAGAFAAGSMAAAMGATATAMSAAFVGGFIGSVGSQLVGKSMGVVEHFSLRQAIGSGLTAGFAAGAGSYLQSAGNGALVAKNADGVATGMKWYGRMAQGATSYLGSVAANKIAGLDVSFNWTDLAVSSVSSVISGSSGNSTADAAKNSGKDFLGNFARNMWSSTVSTSLSRLAGRGEKQDWGAMAADAFGNAIASSIVDKMTTREKWHLLEKRYEELRSRVGEGMRNALDMTEDFVQKNKADGYSLGAITDSIDSMEGAMVLAAAFQDDGTPTFEKVGWISDKYERAKAKFNSTVGKAREKIEHYKATAESALEKVNYVLDVLDEYSGDITEGLVSDSWEGLKDGGLVDIVGGLALIAFDILNSPLSPTPDTGIIGAAMWARRGAKVVDYMSDIASLKELVSTENIASAVKEVAGDLTGLGAGTVGFEDKKVQDAFKKASSKIFDVGAALLQKTAKGSKGKYAIGAFLMSVGQYGERVTVGLLELSGLFESNSGALQNFSGHGVDFIGKARTGKHRGEWIAIEVKSSLKNDAAGLSVRQKKGSNWFVNDILTKAEKGGAWWVPGHSVDTKMQSWAKQIRLDQGRKKFDGYLIQNNKLSVPKIPVDKRVNISTWI